MTRRELHNLLKTTLVTSLKVKNFNTIQIDAKIGDNYKPLYIDSIDKLNTLENYDGFGEYQDQFDKFVKESREVMDAMYKVIDAVRTNKISSWNKKIYGDSIYVNGNKTLIDDLDTEQKDYIKAYQFYKELEKCIFVSDEIAANEDILSTFDKNEIIKTYSQFMKMYKIYTGEAEEAIPEIIKDKKWNKKFYGKDQNVIYLDGDKVELTKQEVKDLNDYLDGKYVARTEEEAEEEAEAEEETAEEEVIEVPELIQGCKWNERFYGKYQDEIYLDGKSRKLDDDEIEELKAYLAKKYGKPVDKPVSDEMGQYLMSHGGIHTKYNNYDFIYIKDCYLTDLIADRELSSEIRHMLNHYVGLRYDLTTKKFNNKKLAAVIRAVADIKDIEKDTDEEGIINDLKDLKEDD